MKCCPLQEFTQVDRCLSQLCAPVLTAPLIMTADFIPGIVSKFIFSLFCLIISCLLWDKLEIYLLWRGSLAQLSVPLLLKIQRLIGNCIISSYFFVFGITMLHSKLQSLESWYRIKQTLDFLDETLVLLEHVALGTIHLVIW